MGIESPSDGLNFNLRRRLGELVRGIAARIEKRSRPAPTPGRVVRGAVNQMVGGILRVGEQLRSAPNPPPDVPGAGSSNIWQGYNANITIDQQQQRLASSLAAMRARLTSAAGYVPAAHAPWPELTIPYIAGVQRRTDITGLSDRKADLDARVLREYAHLQSVDRIRRSASFDALRRLQPRNGTPLAILVANAVRAVLEDIDGLCGSLGEFGVANGSGFAIQEVIYRPKRLRVVVDAHRAVTVPSECVASLEPVANRHVAWDLLCDRPYIRMGNGYIDPERAVDGSPLRKFVIHRGYGDGPARQRGYMYAGHHLAYLSGLSTERLTIVCETYGVSTPYLLLPEGDVQLEEIADAEMMLADLGKGKPAMIRSTWGEVKQTECPSGLLPLHQAVLNYIDATASKLVISNVLSVDVSGTGSYNASSTHQDQLLATQRIDLKLKSETLRTQLLRFIVDINARAWAWAFAPFVPGSCSPDDVRECVPILALELVDPIARLKMFGDAKRDQLCDIDPEQVREECGFRAVAQTSTPTPLTRATPTPPSETRAMPSTQELQAQPAPMSLAVLLPLPAKVAAALAMPNFEPAEQLHVTIATIQSPRPDIEAELSAELAQLFAQAGSLRGTVGGEVGAFDVEDGGTAHWLGVVVDGLDALHDAVVEVLRRYGDVDERPFVPHCTLAYSYGDVDGARYMPAEPIGVEFDEAALSLSPDSSADDWVRFSLCPLPTLKLDAEV